MLVLRPRCGRATSSNCGKFLKPRLPSGSRRGCHGQGNDLGYGNNVEDWVIRSQVLRVPSITRAYWMLFNDYMAVGLGLLRPPRFKIESGRPERGLEEERCNQPGASRCLFMLNRHGTTVPQGLTLSRHESSFTSLPALLDCYCTLVGFSG